MSVEGNLKKPDPGQRIGLLANVGVIAA
jgi:hypothetical protein